ALAVLALAIACARPDAGEPEAATRPAAEVPGVETAEAAPAPVRDLVRAFGTVAAEGEPPEVRDARTALIEAEARRALTAQQLRRLEALAGGVAPRKELDAARAEEAAAAASAARARAILAAFGADAARTALGPTERWLIARVMQVDVPHVGGGAEASFVADALPSARFAASVDAA